MNRQSEIASLLQLQQLMSGGREPTMPTPHSNFDEGGRWQPPSEMRDSAPGYDPNRTLVDDLPGIAAAAAPFALGPAAAGFSRLPTLAKMGLPFLYGMTASARGAEPAGNADLQELRAQLEQAGSPRLKDLQSALQTARERQAAVDAEAGKAKPGSQARSADAARRAVADEVARLQSALDAETERTRGTAMDRANAVMTARSEGEAERKRILDAAPKTFAQSYETLRKDLPALPPFGLMPAVAGAGLVGGLKVIPTIASRGAAKEATALLSKGGPENVAKAGHLADQHARNFSPYSVKDAVTGGVAGLGTAAVPIAYDRQSQPTYNPEKLAADAYLASLLEIDPKRSQAEALAKATPEINPAVSDASLQSYAVKALYGALEGAAGGKAAGGIAEMFKSPMGNVRAAQAEYTDAAAAELLRMKGAEKYGKQAVTVPKPPTYQPPGANPGAGGGPAPGAQAGAGAGVTANPPPAPVPAPPPNPASPAYAAYDETLHRPVARKYLDELLTSGHPSRTASKGQPDPIANMTATLEQRYAAQGLPKVDPKEISARASASYDEATRIADILAATNARRQITNPSIRTEVLDAISGRPGMLSVATPIAGAMAAGRSEMQPEELARLLMIDQAMRGGM